MSTGAQLWDGEEAVVAAARAGDERAFAALSERYRRELRLHCYRMLGSYQDSEDLVQETFLRAWRGRKTFTYQGPSSFRAWLYRLATNACIDVLRSKPRKPFPWQPESVEQRTSGRLSSPDPELSWLQPYPDRLLERIAPDGEQPEAQVIARETIELTFIIAIQLLPPPQRAVLILRDVLGWSAKETAALLGTTTVSANSSLQRARATLRRHLPARRLDWAPPSEPTGEERAVFRRYMDAHDRRDFAAIAQLLREDARLTMPPTPSWFEGRDAITALFASWLDPESAAYVGEVQRIEIGANRQLACAGYLRRPGDSEYRPLGLEVLRIEDGQLAESTMFVSPELFPAFGLPTTL
jgi:RNA polymerase sigma-70 factor (ECF subfamily)